MTRDQRRILHAAKHASVYKPSLMKAKSLDYLEVFLLQSRCRLHELYGILNQFLIKEPLNKEDIELFWDCQQDLAELQSDITTLIQVKDQLVSVTDDFRKAGKEITDETISIYLQQAKEEADCEQDPNNDIRSKLEKLL